MGSSTKGCEFRRTQRMLQGLTTRSGAASRISKSSGRFELLTLTRNLLAAGGVTANCYPTQDRDVRSGRPEVVTVQEAASKLGVHVNTVRNWVRSGYIASHQPAGPKGRILIAASAVRSLTSESVVVPEDVERSLPSGAPPCRNSGSPSNNEEIGPVAGCSSLSATVNALLGRLPPTTRRKQQNASSGGPRSRAG